MLADKSAKMAVAVQKELDGDKRDKNREDLRFVF